MSHNKFVNRTLIAALRFAVASPLYRKTLPHKKFLLQRRQGALTGIVEISLQDFMRFLSNVANDSNSWDFAK